MQHRLVLREFSLVIALVVICAFFAIASPQFLSARNLSLLVTELSITATLAMGMLLVILPGNIDLSVGSGVGLLGGIASVLVFEHNWPAPGGNGHRFSRGHCYLVLHGQLDRAPENTGFHYHSRRPAHL
jgi:D-xylose transport system permease protein